MPKQTIFYTGTGDEGYTQLLGKDRVPKYALQPEAYGTVDEASALMGLARANPAASEHTRRLILQAQRDLWRLMGELASAPEVELPQHIGPEQVAWLETEIDRLAEEIPPLTRFVIPGDTEIGALLDVARTVVRRGERRVAQLLHENILANIEILRYLNRLSSLLFALARYEEHRAGLNPTLTREAQ